MPQIGIGRAACVGFAACAGSARAAGSFGRAAGSFGRAAGFGAAFCTRSAAGSKHCGGAAECAHGAGRRVYTKTCGSEGVPSWLRNALSALLLHPVSGALARLERRRARAAFCVERLPALDASLELLTDAERDALARHWQRRAGSEQRIGLAFKQMVPILRAVGAKPIVLRLLELSWADELRHAEVCVAVAARYAGKRVDLEQRSQVLLPQFHAHDERLEAALLVAGTCCVNETLATVWLEQSLAASRAPLAVFANRAHLRDEIDHARLGWAHLASDALDADLRAVLAECVPRLLAANLPLWLEPDPLIPRAGIAGHGQPPHAEVERAIQRAVAEILVPGFAHVGVHVAAGSATASELESA